MLVFISPKFGKHKPVSTLPPLGIMYLSSFLNKYNIKTRIIDGSAEELSIDEVIRIVKKENPEYVGISMMTCQVYDGIKIAEGIKKVCRKTLIVGGGSHISATKEELFKFTDSFDFLVYGEGEETLYELLICKKKGLYLDCVIRRMTE